METTEGNKLIAEFVGFKEVATYGDNGKVYEIPEDHPTHTGEMADDTLLFHSSWDWLMPVVEKIESDPVNDVCIYKEATQIRIWSGDDQVFKWKRLEPDGSSKIAHTWRAVICYIKYYNEQKQSA